MSNRYQTIMMQHNYIIRDMILTVKDDQDTPDGHVLVDKKSVADERGRSSPGICNLFRKGEDMVVQHQHSGKNCMENGMKIHSLVQVWKNVKKNEDTNNIARCQLDI